MCRFAAIGSATTSAPHTTAVPLMSFMVVDLPAPLGPRKPNTSPRATSNDTSSTARNGPKCRFRRRTSIILSMLSPYSRHAVPPAAAPSRRPMCSNFAAEIKSADAPLC